MIEWSPEEDAIIREMAATSTAAIIAERLPGRTGNAVISRARRLKVKLPRKPLVTSPWTPEVTAEAVRLRGLGMTNGDIAKRLGLTRESVKYKLLSIARETPIEGSRKSGARKPHWPKERLQTLRDAAADPALTWEERAKLCGVSRSSTMRMAHELGLYRPMDRAEQIAHAIEKANAARIRKAQERRANAPLPQPRQPAPRTQNAKPPAPVAKPNGHVWGAGTFNFRAPAAPKPDTANDDKLIAEYLAKNEVRKLDPAAAWGSVIPQYIGKSGFAA